MKRTLIASALCILCAATQVFAREVIVVMKSSEVVKGNLIGANSSTLYLDNMGTAVELPLPEIRDVFDAKSHEHVALNLTYEPEEAAIEEPVQTETAETAPKMKRAARHHAARAGKPMVMAAAGPASPFSVGFQGIVGSGRLGFTPCLPQGTGFSGGLTPFESSFGFGMSLEYSAMPEVHVFLDGNAYSSNVLLAKQGGFSSGDWVFEQSGFTSHLIGPFPTDAYYFMDTAGFRLGGKYVIASGMFQPWVGAGFGIYSWKVDFATPDRTQTYGSDSGMATSLTYLAGVDLVLDPTFALSFFADLTSEVVHPRVENLFHPGYTWESIGGEHIMPPYRFGAAIRMSI